MNWWIHTLIKEARARRFGPADRVRYFTENRKGKGKGVVLTPTFGRGTVVDYNSETKRYNIRNHEDQIVEIHPRNIVPDSISRNEPQPSVSLPQTVEVQNGESQQLEV